MDDSKVQFSTAFNYQKIADKSPKGGETVSATASWPSYTTIKTVSHNLGYIPSVRVWYDPQIGRRFPVSIEQYTDDDFSTHYTNQVGIRVRLTSTQLIIQAGNASGSTKNVTLWWRVYYDG